MAEQAHVSEFKKNVVAEFVKLFKKYPIVGAVNMESLPAQQLNTLRRKLRDKCVIIMTKRRLVKQAIAQAGVEGLDKLIPYMKGMPALLFTEQNPFAIYKVAKDNKSKAPAKAGQIAPNDIKVSAGPTQFVPGPVIGELGALGIKSKVDAGKIAILEDTIVCKEGEEISMNLASMLTRLNILPMEVGLNITAVFENGEILDKSVLDIDDEQFERDLTGAILHALNLSVEFGYITPDNIELMISKAVSDARGVAKECGVLTADLIGDYLAQGVAESNALVSEFNIDLTKVSEPKKEEPKVEEKKEEPKVEAPKVEEKSKEEPKVEEKKEEVKPEEPKVEEKKAEEKPKEEVKEESKVEAPKVEEKKEEPKVEEKPKEEPKVEPPKVEEKKEEPKVEEKPKEEPKVEPPKVEEKKEEPKVEEKKEEAPVEPVKEEATETQGVSEHQNSKVNLDETKPSAVNDPSIITEEKMKEVKEAMEKNLEKEKEQEKRDEIADLAQELVKKGTLRK